MDSSGTRRPDSRQLTRQWGILKLLQRNTYSVRELAERLCTTKSTIQRDIATLETHFVIESLTVGKQKRVYRLPANTKLPQVRITEVDLDIFCDVISELDDDVSSQLRSLFHKLQGFI